MLFPIGQCFMQIYTLTDSLDNESVNKILEKLKEVRFRLVFSFNFIELSNKYLSELLRFWIKTVRERTEALAEACICYTGDLKYQRLVQIDLAFKAS